MALCALDSFDKKVVKQYEKCQTIIIDPSKVMTPDEAYKSMSMVARNNMAFMQVKRKIGKVQYDPNYRDNSLSSYL